MNLASPYTEQHPQQPAAKEGVYRRMLWVRAPYRELRGIKAVCVGKKSSRIF